MESQTDRNIPVTYLGPATNLGRWGAVATGQLLLMDPQELATVDGNVNFCQSTARQRELKLTGSATLTNEDSGRKVIMYHSEPCTVTLPAAPAAGDCFEIYFSPTASADNVTVARNGKLIDGVAANLTITQAQDSRALYFNGIGWISY